jgi:anthranilate synthase component 1
VDNLHGFFYGHLLLFQDDRMKKNTCFPSLPEFISLADGHSHVPLCCEVVADLDTPLSLYRKVARGPYTFLLESLEGGERWGRYSIIGLEPQLVFCQRREQVTIIRAEEREIRSSATDPLAQLQELLAAFTPAPVAGLPAFYGGAVGFLSYDVVKKFEFLPDNADDDTGFADALFMVPGLLLVHDNLKNTLVIIALVRVDGRENPETCYGCGLELIDELIARLKTPTAYDLPDAAVAELERGCDSGGSLPALLL